MQAQTQSPIIKNKKYKEMKDLPKTWVLRGKQIEDFRRKKKQKHYSRPSKKNQWNTRTLNALIEQGPSKQ